MYKMSGPSLKIVCLSDSTSSTWSASAPFSGTQGKTNTKYSLEGLKPSRVHAETHQIMSHDAKRQVKRNAIPFSISAYPMRRSCSTNSAARSWVKLVSYIPFCILLLVLLIVGITSLRAQYFKGIFLKLKQFLWDSVRTSDDAPEIVEIFSPREF